MLAIGLAITFPSQVPALAQGGAPPPTPSPTPIWEVPVPWPVVCDDDAQENGYMNQGLCVPGVVTRDAWYFTGLFRQRGTMSSYAPGLMKATAAARGLSLDGYVGGVAVMSCAHLGQRAWILIDGEWLGPFRIVDCSARNDMFVNVLYKGLVVEVGYDMAQRLGRSIIHDVGLAIYYPPKDGDHWKGPWLDYYWRNNVLRFEWASWLGGDYRAATATATPMPSATATATARPSVTPTAAATATLRAAEGYDRVEPSSRVRSLRVPEQEADMKRLNIMRALLVIAVLSLLVVAAAGPTPERLGEIIAGIVGFAVMLFGPKPLKKLYDVLRIPGGPWRVLATYVASGIVGLAALAIAGQFTDFTMTPDSVLALAGILATAAQLAYHRLKDLYGSALST